MDRREFDRQLFGDTAPLTEIDYDFHRHRATMERRAAIAAFPGQVAAMFIRARSALARLGGSFMRIRWHAPRHQNLRAEDR
jgi:hypothetical protein